jgi:hypothetical protein
MLGTLKYARAVEAKSIVLQASKCHTLDRNNFRAQKDEECGIGVKND